MKAAEDPQEMADLLTKDELHKVVSAATADMVQAAWDARANTFLRWLNGKERIWFG